MPEPFELEVFSPRKLDQFPRVKEIIQVIRETVLCWHCRRTPEMQIEPKPTMKPQSVAFGKQLGTPPQATYGIYCECTAAIADVLGCTCMVIFPQTSSGKASFCPCDKHSNKKL